MGPLAVEEFTKEGEPGGPLAVEEFTKEGEFISSPERGGAEGGGVCIKGEHIGSPLHFSSPLSAFSL